ncbi:MAG TPA: hypothetical protein VF857_10340, partial [Spirochaetota bacterium]
MSKMLSTDKQITSHDYELYREYWEHNRETVEAVSKGMQTKLIELEKHSYQADVLYHQIESALSTLS